MALVTRATDASVDTSTAMYAPQITGLIAGEDIDVCAPCYIKTADNKVYMSNATAANEAAEFAGFSPRAAKAGQPVTLFGYGTRMKYASGLTPGNILYIGATKGRLDDAATTGDGMGVAQVLTPTDIRVSRAGVNGALGAGALGAGSVATANLAAGAVTFAKLAMFVSAEQTGTGGAQNIAHGLGATPAKVVVVPTDLTPATVGQYAATQGAHDGTNVVVTVTTGKKYVVMAWA